MTELARDSVIGTMLAGVEVFAGEVLVEIKTFVSLRTMVKEIELTEFQDLGQ